MATPPLIAFHLQVGARVALRTLAPLFAVATAAVVLYQDPTVILAPVIALVFPPAPSLVAGMLATALAATIATLARPRLALGLGGWLRHLPATGVAHRRALTLGLVAAQWPFLVLLVVAGGMAWGSAHHATSARLLGLIPCAWGACLTVLRVRRPAARALAAAAATAACSGYWASLPAALALLLGAELTAGELDLARRRPLAPARRADERAADPPTVGRRAELRLAAVIAWRSLRWRLPAAWCLALPALVPAALFLHNNALPAAHRVGAACLAGLVSAVLVTTGLAGQLAKRRPPWPWVRSLPWSALERTAADAVLLLVAVLPVPAAAATMAPAALPAMLAVLPLLAARGASAIRGRRDGAWGAAGPLAEGMLAAVLVTLVPWLAVAALALTPLAVGAAARAERRQTTGRWDELQHLAAGDPLSWSAE